MTDAIFDVIREVERARARRRHAVAFHDSASLAVEIATIQEADAERLALAGEPTTIEGALALLDLVSDTLEAWAEEDAAIACAGAVRKVSATLRGELAE